MSMAKNAILLLEKPKEQTDSQNNGISAEERSNRERDIKSEKEFLKMHSKNTFGADKLKIDSPVRGSIIRKIDKLENERYYWKIKANNEKDPVKREEYIKRSYNLLEKKRHLEKLSNRNRFIENRAPEYKQTNDPKRIQELQEKSKMIIRKRDHLDDMYRNGKISREKYIKAIGTIDDGLIRIAAMIKKHV